MAVSTLTALPNSTRPLGLVGSGGECIVQFLTARIDYADVATAATYNIFDLPAKSAVLFCWFVVETAWTVGTSILIDESTGAGTYITATQGAAANLSLGSVIKGHTYSAGLSILGTDVGDDAEYDLVARTVDLTTVGTWSTGVGTLIIGFVTLP